MLDTRDEETILAHREGIILGEMKKKLNYRTNVAAAESAAAAMAMGGSSTSAPGGGDDARVAENSTTLDSFKAGALNLFRRSTSSSNNNNNNNNNNININDVSGRSDGAGTTVAGASPISFISRLNANMSAAAVDGFLVRYLRDKHLSTAEAIAKLKRRRMFERTLPTISVTPSVITALRSGALQLIGKDYRNRWVLLLNLEDYNVPALEQDDAQRLLIVLLEFMQTQCMLLAEENEQIRQQSGVNNEQNTNHLRRNNTEESGEEAEEIKRVPKPYQQQFVIVVNEENANFRSHLPLLKNIDTLYTVFSKYYPELVDLILVVGASFEIRQGIKAALACSPQAARKMVLLIQKGDLQQYMDPAILPAALSGADAAAGAVAGPTVADKRKKARRGSHNSNTAAAEVATNMLYASAGAQLSEVVLRHWFTITAYLQQEMATTLLTEVAHDADNLSSAAKERPLYIPPPFLVPVQEMVLWQRALFCSHSVVMHHYFPFVHLAAAAGGLDSFSRGMYVAPSLGGSRAASTATTPQKNAKGGAAAAGPRVVVVNGESTNNNNNNNNNNAGPPDLGTLTMEGICSVLSESDLEEELSAFSEDDDNSIDGASASSASRVGRHRSRRLQPVNSVTSVDIDVGGPRGAGNRKANRPTSSGTTAAAAMASAVAVTEAELAEIRADVDVAVRLIEQERQQRAEAEKRLMFLQLGITLDPKTMSKVESQLTSIHQEVNALVANVIVRAKAAAASSNNTTGGATNNNNNTNKKGGKESATLRQYIDLTIAVLEATTGGAESVPALAFSTPAQRDEPPDSCCSVM